MNQANSENPNPFDDPAETARESNQISDAKTSAVDAGWSTPRSIAELAVQRDDQKVGHRFTLINDRVLRVDLGEPASGPAESTSSGADAPSKDIWIKTGAMIAYEGEVEFIREGLLEKGVGKMIKKVVTGEGTPLTRATGRGRLYLADAGKRVHLLKLESEALFVRGSSLIAMETNVDWDIGVVPKLSAVVASSLFNVQLHGSGAIAISSHFEPIVLNVSEERPIFTDPDATIAWSGGLTPEYRAALTVQTFLGRGSGEAVQMEFRGDGFVVVQPFEEGMLHA